MLNNGNHNSLVEHSATQRRLPEIELVESSAAPVAAPPERFFVVLSWAGWQFEEMVRSDAAPGLWAYDAPYSKASPALPMNK